MAARKLPFRSVAREALLRGAGEVVDAVRLTLGPKSKCVLIDKQFGRPIVCNDGVTMPDAVQGMVEKTHVATISAHNDSTIGKRVSEAFEKIGPEGAITVEEAGTTETMLDVVEGGQFDRGFISSYLVSDPNAMEAALD